MPLGSFKASILGASAATGETYWAGLWYQERASGDYITLKPSHDLDASGNIVCVACDNSNNPTGFTIDGGDTPSVTADSGGYFDSFPNWNGNGTVKVRADGKLALGWASYAGGYVYYSLHTSSSDWSVASGFTPYYVNNPTYTGSASMYYSRAMDSWNNEDFLGAHNLHNSLQITKPHVYKARSSGTSGNVTLEWEGNRAGNDEKYYDISLNSNSDMLWTTWHEETGSSILPIQFLGFDKDTSDPGDAGTTKKTLGASGYGFHNSRYTARSGYDTAGYLVSAISWPNTAYGITVAKATSADDPESLAWVRKIQFGSPAYTYSDSPRNCAQPVLDSAGNVYVAYRVKLLSPNKQCYIIASWENDGTFRWARTLMSEGSSNYQYTSEQQVVLSITDNDSLVFTGITGITTSGTDHPAVLIARLPTDGSLTSSSPIQPRGDSTANIYWMNDLTGNWAPTEAAGNLVAGSDTGEYFSATTGTTTNLGTSTTSNTRSFVQAEVTG